ncbi:MAG: transposase [Okeania sp. SIO3C4]|nr:transposase [Okeania sp. SIO3B3]NER08456.1 transposase [Okeania sp. SIO3C4]
MKLSKLPVHPLLDERQYETFGIDVGVKQFASIANQKKGNNVVLSLPDSIKLEQLKIAKFQWRNRMELGSKGKPPSKNAIKYYKKLVKYHGRVKNLRRDFIEKTTTKLVSQIKQVCAREFKCERDDEKW